MKKRIVITLFCMSLMMTACAGGTFQYDGENSIDISQELSEIENIYNETINSLGLSATNINGQKKIIDIEFDKGTTYGIHTGLYLYRVPTFFASISKCDDELFRTYSETGDVVSMLNVNSSYDENDPVGYHWLEGEENLANMRNGIMNGFQSDARILEEREYSTVTTKGRFYKVEGNVNGKEIILWYYIFPSEEDNSWFLIYIYEDKLSKYSYEKVFFQIINSLEYVGPIDESESSKNLPEDTINEALIEKPEESNNKQSNTNDGVNDQNNTSQGNITKSDSDDKKSLSYSTNDLENAKKGESGVFAYRDNGSNYYNYYIIDFDEGYVYFFTEGNGNDNAEKLKIQSGTLNDVVLITYHDNGNVWSNGLHFKWSRQPDHLILEDQNHYEYDYYSTDLAAARKLLEKKTIYEY